MPDDPTSSPPPSPRVPLPRLLPPPAAAAPGPWEVRLPGAAPTLGFTPADPLEHATLVRRWLHEPHVRRWWRSAGDRPTVEYLAAQRRAGHVVPWVVAADGEPFGYVETYRPDQDPLGRAHPFTPADRGWHVLVGPAEVIGTGIPRLLGRAVLARLLAEPGVDRVVCEPDERNERMVAFCRALGHAPLATLDLPDKRATLLAAPAASFRALWPGDVEAVAATGAAVAHPSRPA